MYFNNRSGHCKIAPGSTGLFSIHEHFRRRGIAGKPHAVMDNARAGRDRQNLSLDTPILLDTMGRQ